MCLPFVQSSLRDGIFYTAFRGLKPTAKFIVPLRGRGKGSAGLWANATCPMVGTTLKVPAYI
jgi:hypothetical protein